MTLLLRVLIGSFLWMICLEGRAQSGFHYLTHYQHTFPNLDYQNNDILQDKRGLLYFANRRGVLVFDGSNWEHIITEGSVYALAQSAADDLRVFVGGKSNFGYIEHDAKGTTSYTSLSGDTYTGYDFMELEVVGNTLYAFADELLIKFNLEKQKIENTWYSKPGDELTGFFMHNGVPYIVREAHGALRIEGEQLAAVDMPFINNDELLYYTPLEDGSTLLGTLGGKIYRFDGNKVTQIQLEEEGYFRKSEPVSAIALEDNLVAFATLRGGCLMLDVSSGKVTEILNTQSGMPVNEMLAVGKDQAHGLWITHSYGYTRLDLRLPYQNFSYYGALTGRITDVKWNNGKLYVSTTEGLFALEEVKNYRKVDYVVQQTIDPSQVLKKGSVSSSRQQVGTSIAESEGDKLFKQPTLKLQPDLQLDPETGTLTRLEDEELSRKEERQLRRQERRRSRLVRRLQRQQEKTETDTEETESTDTSEEEREAGEEETTKEEETDEENSEPDTETSVFSATTAKTQRSATKKKVKEYRLQVKRELELQSVKYLYEPVKGLGEGQVTDLISLNGSLIILHQDGIYAMKDKQLKKVLTVNADELYVPHNSTGKHIYYLSKDLVGALRWNERGHWEEDWQLSRFNDQISGLATDPAGRLWAIGNNFIHHIITDEIKNTQKSNPYTISNDFDDEAIPTIQNDTLFFLLSEATYYFDDEIARFVADTNKPLRTQSSGTVISVDEQLLWLEGTEQWKIYGQHPYNENNAFLLKLIGDLQEIIPDIEENYVWVVTRNNQLFRFRINNKLDLSHEYPMLLRRVTNSKTGEIRELNDIRIDYESNNISLLFHTPDFLSGEKLVYQYILLGGRTSNTDWSEWKRDNEFDFSSLDEGTYTFKVRSKNIFGDIVESERIRFTVLPPYWQTSWFYALETAFFAFLVGITAFFNRRLTQESRWIVLLRQTLTILTLIMCMEFLKVVLENWINVSGSPVVDFGMEVIFALLIFPVERLFSHYVFRNRSHFDHLAN